MYEDVENTRLHWSLWWGSVRRIDPEDLDPFSPYVTTALLRHLDLHLHRLIWRGCQMLRIRRV
jgi:hypothetical protein